MRRSFGGNRGMGSGGMGGCGGGGGMLRTVLRAVRAGVGGAAQDPFSHSSTNNNNSSSSASRKTNKPTTSNVISLSSSSSSPSLSSPKTPISASLAGPTLASCSSPVSSDGFDWECVDGNEDERAYGYGFCDDFVFGSVPPSRDEVQNAVSSLQQVLDPSSFSQFVRERFAYASDRDVTDQDTSPIGVVHRVSSVGSELDWIEPSMQLYNPMMLQPYGHGRVYDAFRLLQTETSIQKMVISLSSDKTVWDAVLNNEVVRELRESFNADTAETHVPESLEESSGDSNGAKNVLYWIFNNMKEKVLEVFEKITKLVNELFLPQDTEKSTAEKDPFEEKLRTSFMLSVVVVMIVVLTRAQTA